MKELLSVLFIPVSVIPDRRSLLQAEIVEEAKLLSLLQSKTSDQIARLQVEEVTLQRIIRDLRDRMTGKELNAFWESDMSLLNSHTTFRPDDSGEDAALIAKLLQEPDLENELSDDTLVDQLGNNIDLIDEDDEDLAALEEMKSILRNEGSTIKREEHEVEDDDAEFS